MEAQDLTRSQELILLHYPSNFEVIAYEASVLFESWNARSLLSGHTRRQRSGRRRSSCAGQPIPLERGGSCCVCVSLSLPARTTKDKLGALGVGARANFDRGR